MRERECVASRMPLDPETRNGENIVDWYFESIKYCVSYLFGCYFIVINYNYRDGVCVRLSYCQVPSSLPLRTQLNLLIENIGNLDTSVFWFLVYESRTFCVEVQ